MSSPSRPSVLNRLTYRFLTLPSDGSLLNCGKALYKRSQDAFSKAYSPDHFFGMSADAFLACKEGSEFEAKLDQAFKDENAAFTASVVAVDSNLAQDFQDQQRDAFVNAAD